MMLPRCDNTWYLISTLFCWLIPSSVSQNTDVLAHNKPREYCWEQFEAKCPSHNQVILMTSARYGRMRFGRCVTRDYYIGCAADVLSVVDRKCSGHRNCQVTVPNTEMQKLQPCPADLMAYLEAEYECVNVTTSNYVTCENYGGPITVHSSEGYLASIVTRETGLGNQKCPWIIRVSAGQRINITLLDFDVTPTFARNDVCHVYAVIRDLQAPHAVSEVTVCGGGDKRVKSVFLSETNAVEVEVMAGLSISPDTVPYFLLRYTSVGCADLHMEGWLRQDKNRAMIFCNATGDKWYLTCEDNVWRGARRNCTYDALNINSKSFVTESINFTMDAAPPIGFIIAVLIGILLGVSFGVILLASVYVCRKRRLQNGTLQKTQPSSVQGFCDTTDYNVVCQPPAAMASVYISRPGVKLYNYGHAESWELRQLQNNATSLDRCATLLAKDVSHNADSASSTDDDLNFKMQSYDDREQSNPNLTSFRIDYHTSDGLPKQTLADNSSACPRGCKIVKLAPNTYAGGIHAVPGTCQSLPPDVTLYHQCTVNIPSPDQKEITNIKAY